MDSQKEKYARPLIHLTPVRGRLNDPNGLVFSQGRWQVFYQLAPDFPAHRRLHWAHCWSDDLVNWSEARVVLAPDQWYDRDGCYSGSAIVINDRLHIYYTGNVRGQAGRESYQCLAQEESGIGGDNGDNCGDGSDKGRQASCGGETSLRKSADNPLIAGPPPGFTAHFRDPKVDRLRGASQSTEYRASNLADQGAGQLAECGTGDPVGGGGTADHYRMIIGAQRAGQGQSAQPAGSALLYYSTDGINWRGGEALEFSPALASGEIPAEAFMWECPNLLTLPNYPLPAPPPPVAAEPNQPGVDHQSPEQTGKTPEAAQVGNPDAPPSALDVLIFCPQTQEDGQQVSRCGYITGLLQGSTLRQRSAFIPLDFGDEFYAPQVFSGAEDVMLAWVGTPEHDGDPDQSWFHALTLPRRLKLVNGSLRQMPAVDMQAYGQPLASAALKESAPLAFLNDCESFWLRCRPHFGGADSEITLRIREHADQQVLLLRLNPRSVTLDRTLTGAGARTPRNLFTVALDSPLQQLELVLDHSVGEIFLNCGEATLTFRAPFELPGGVSSIVLSKESSLDIVRARDLGSKEEAIN